jgi:hypothetical protein
MKRGNKMKKLNLILIGLIIATMYVVLLWWTKPISGEDIPAPSRDTQAKLAKLVVEEMICKRSKAIFKDSISISVSFSKDFLSEPKFDVYVKNRSSHRIQDLVFGITYFGESGTPIKPIFEDDYTELRQSYIIVNKKSSRSFSFTTIAPSEWSSACVGIYGLDVVWGVNDTTSVKAYVSGWVFDTCNKNGLKTHAKDCYMKE